MPSPSYYPMILSLGITLLAGGLVSHLAVSFVGGFISIASIYLWALEPATAPSAHDDQGAH